MRGIAVFLLIVALAVAGCGEGRGNGAGGTGEADEGSDPLLVLAAADLQAAFDALVPLYRERTGERVDVVLGSTGNLAAQIRHGAPADLFFAADASFVDDLVEAGRVEPASRRLYAVGRLVLVAPPGAPPPPDVGALADPGYAVVAIANPEHAPYGRAARQALEAAGAWDAVSPRLVLGENIMHAYQFVRTGNADAGLVALGLVRGVPGPPVPYTLVDSALHAPLRQVAGVVAGAERAEQARRFLDFVMSADGRGVLARFGFERP